MLPIADSQVPYQKLRLFLDKIGIDGSGMEILDPFRPLFVSKKDEFAAYFYDLFLGIPDTRAILEGERKPGLLKAVWAGWFERFFSTTVSDSSLTYLWRIGGRHVEVGLDQRFSNLGFAVIRQFCHSVIFSEAPPDKRCELLAAIDKLVDLCVLVETAAYIANATSCDLEVMREVADRVRNPAMIIGWSVKKLLDKTGAGTREHKVYEMLMSENRRLEEMVRDIKVYTEIFENEPKVQRVDLQGVLAPVLEKLLAELKAQGIKVEVDIPEGSRYVNGDPQWIGYLFYYLLQNGIEATNADNALVKVTSTVQTTFPFNLEIEIFNTGNPPSEKVEQLLLPFFSTKVTGTGFGLPIARLVVRKHRGTFSFQAAPSGQGTRVLVGIPAAGKTESKDRKKNLASDEMTSRRLKQ